MVIPYNNIEEKYCSDREFILYVNFPLLIYIKTTKKRVNTDLYIYKTILMMSNTNVNTTE